jgi:hypothetical protein
MIASPFEIKSGEWQEIVVHLTASQPIGTVRAYLPDADIDFIDITPDKGKPLRSDF